MRDTERASQARSWPEKEGGRRRTIIALFSREEEEEGKTPASKLPIRKDWFSFFLSFVHSFVEVKPDGAEMATSACNANSVCLSEEKTKKAQSGLQVWQFRPGTKDSVGIWARE